ncbi:unnamed protein product [Lactuca saligna]|uniref:DUF4283 domain-containing protein n=1 Tax=Lactuca saligna TaxID=75948 RepID=A0AA36E0A8_LACSI|nr:unnamed protein product [Lactuca saligna]
MESLDGWQQVRRKKKLEENYSEDYDVNERAVTTFKTSLRTGTNRRCGKLSACMGPWVRDLRAFESRLNEILIGAKKIRVNVAKFDRKGQESRNITPHLKGKPRASYNHASLHTRVEHEKGRSYADAVKGPPPSQCMGVTEDPMADIRNLNNARTDEKSIRMISTEGSKECINSTLVGETESFQTLMNVKALPEVEGCPNIQLRCLGGMKMLLDFKSVQEKNDFLSNGEAIWRPWFKSLTNWSMECNYNERIASIIIQGVPQHVWCEEAFNSIAKLWGSVVIPEECSTDSPNLAFGRVGILTSHPGLISLSIPVYVDGIRLEINVMEDVFESLKLSLVLESNDFQYPNGNWWYGGGREDDYAAQSEEDPISPILSPAYSRRSQDWEYEKLRSCETIPVPEEHYKNENTNGRQKGVESSRVSQSESPPPAPA